MKKYTLRDIKKIIKAIKFVNNGIYSNGLTLDSFSDKEYMLMIRDQINGFSK